MIVFTDHRVQCDLTQPTCNRCRRAGLKCGGYRRQRVFVNSTKYQPLNGKGYSLCPHDGDSVGKITQPDSLTHTAYKAKFLGLFWGTYYPEGSRLQTNTWGSSGDVLSVIYRLSPEDGTLQRILLATSLFITGRQDGKTWMTREGQAIYCATLGKIKSLLKCEIKVLSDGVLATVKALSLFEVNPLGSPQSSTVVC